MKKRVRALLDADLNLLAYHLPLDRHADVGNNAPALRALGGVDLEPFAPHGGQPIGWRGRLAAPVAGAGVPRARRGVLRREGDGVPRRPGDDPHRRRRVGRRRRRTRRRPSPLGLDCFITGEISEPNLHIAQEEGLNHISIGHHASERVGARELAAYLGRTFGVEAEFVDVPNPA